MIELKPTTTVAEIIADGCTHLEATCRCGRSTQTPFQMGKYRVTLTLADLAMRLKCEHCGQRPATLRGTVLEYRRSVGPTGSYAYEETPMQKALRFMEGEPLDPLQE